MNLNGKARIKFRAHVIARTDRSLDARLEQSVFLLGGGLERPGTLRRRVPDHLKSGSYRPSVQLSEKASAQVLKGRDSRSRGQGWPLASLPLRVRRAARAGIRIVQTP